MEAFLTRHPETVRAVAVLKGREVSSGFDNTTFYGLNAFRLVSPAGGATPVRWLLTPEQAVEAAKDARGPREKNYLFDALVARMSRGPLNWHLIAVVGQPGDPTDDATTPWPEGRERVDLGTLTLEKVEAEEASAATDLNFDPLVLPAGIAPSNDPLLSARSAVYSRSFTRRAGETKEPSAVTPADMRKGG
jgi:catalase